MGYDSDSSTDGEGAKKKEQDVPLYEEQNKDEYEYESSGDEEAKPAAPARERQKVITKPTHSRYPAKWNGIVRNADGVEEIYGLIICVQGKLCYILTSEGCMTYEPQISAPSPKIIGCWMKLKLDLNGYIRETPELVRPPLHTRVFHQGKLPWLLIYDYVNVLSSREVKSKFLGTISNNKVDLRDDDGRLFEQCNVEYTIQCGIDRGLFTYETNVVKFHGSVNFYSDLPQLLSVVNHEDNNVIYADDYFKDAFYTQEEKDVFEKQRYERAQRRQLKELRLRAGYGLFRERPSAKANENEQPEIMSQQNQAPHEKAREPAPKMATRPAVRSQNSPINLVKYDQPSPASGIAYNKNLPNARPAFKNPNSATNSSTFNRQSPTANFAKPTTAQPAIKVPNPVRDSPVNQQVPNFEKPTTARQAIKVPNPVRDSPVNQYAPNFAKSTTTQPAFRAQPAQTKATTARIAVRAQNSGSTTNFNSQVPSSQNVNRSRRTILITHGAFGHAFNLAKSYLDKGHRVILHSFYPHTEKHNEELKRTYGDDCVFLGYSDLQDETFVAKFIEAGIKKFGSIDTVFHFYSAICKPGQRDMDESFRYLFKVNVKPFTYIVKHVLLKHQSTQSVQLIIVGPIVSRNVIMEELIPGVEKCTEYLNALLEAAESSPAVAYPVNTYCIEHWDLGEIELNTQQKHKEVSDFLMKAEKKLLDN